VGAREAEVVHQRGDRAGQHARRGRPVERRRAAEAGQIDGDHVAVARQALHHRLPHDQLRPERVDQDERVAAAPAQIVQRSLSPPSHQAK